MDKELQTMATIDRTLKKLDQAQRDRVLAWVDAKTKEGAWKNPPQQPVAKAAELPNVARAN